MLGKIIKRFCSGFSYFTKIILAVSITLPPPMAINIFGLYSSQTFAPSSMVEIGTSGKTPDQTL